jgi:hypothetical protein
MWEIGNREKKLRLELREGEKERELWEKVGERWMSGEREGSTWPIWIVARE